MDADQAGTLRNVGSPMVAGLAAAGFVDAKVVGRGGFGVVYRCSQEALDRVVAVKVLTATLADDRTRFVREQQAMARLTGHPNIVPVFQVGELAAGLPFLVMPFCANGCVQERIARLVMLPVAEVLRVGVKLAGALASAHRLGIVHRDIKPANILLTDYGEPALCDFGIARIVGGFQTATGLFAGSPAFVAPEVISGDAPTAASDVYGVGASLFAALTGHAPFERRTGEQVVAQLMRIASDAVPDLREYGIADDVAEVISAAMARDPRQRPSPLQLGQQLQQLQAHHGLPVDEMALHDPDGSQRREERSAPAPGPVPERTTPGNLPAPVSKLVGRGQQLARLGELVASSRLVTVTGIGGIGKTTLATHAAREFGSDFPGGVWLVELAELRDAMLLTEVIAAALGVRDQPGRSLTEALVGFLAPRRVLLVLDNCEHLIDDVAKLAETLLRDCASLKILATSREAFDIGGEAVLALASLPCPSPGDDPTVRTLAGYEAVALFVERAREALPGFTLTEANAAAVTRICARLEGVPLALELAAARVRMMSAEQIAEGLSDRFRLLRRGRRGAPDRQHSLTGCIDWSYRLCTPTEQHVWARLSVFAGSFDPAAVQHLCAEQLEATECFDVLGALVDKSIVVRTEHDDRAMRFRLPDTLREYGQAHLSNAEQDEMRQRHAEWYHQLSSQAWAERFGPGQLQWLHRIGLEMPNIREALQFNLTDNPVAALRMTTNVYMFWQLCGMLVEVRQWLDLALSATVPHPTDLRIRGLGYAATVAAMQRDLSAAQARIAEGRALLEAVDSADLHASIHHAEGLLALFSGQVERARDSFQRALDSTDDYEIQTTSMYCMGTMLGFLGDPDSGLRWLEKAFALAESRGDPYLRACTQNGMAISLWRRGEVQRTQQLMREALHTFSVLNDLWNGAHCLEVLAWIAGSLHHSRRASVLLAAASALGAAAGAPLNPIPEMVAWHDECESRAREDLGPAEFETAWAQGTALNIKRALDVALTDTATQAGHAIEQIEIT